MTPPVLFLIFNRPDLVDLSFRSIRDAKPRQLFIAADGPRADRPGEESLCQSARSVVAKVDWDCDVKTLFRTENLGCRLAVSSAITWFFEHVDEGIILEDDCVANSCFFPFCAELLARYREDSRVMCITGNNFQNGRQCGDDSYYFSIYNTCWGWASWRRAWEMFDADLVNWPQLRDREFLKGFLAPQVVDFWKFAFESVDRKTVDTWDYIWTFSAWANSGLTAVPSCNLVANVGFDTRATHTTQLPLTDLPQNTTGIEFPLVHPKVIFRDAVADQFMESKFYGFHRPQSSSLGRRAINRMRNAVAALSTAIRPI